MLKEVLVRLSVVAFVCCLSVTAHAMADQTSHVNVPPGDLTAGLEMLAKQSGAEFVYSADQLKGLHTRGVAGDLSAKDAVTKLLEGTPLQVRMDASGAMLIVPPTASATAQASPAPGDNATQEGKSNSSDNFLLAQATAGQAQGDASVENNKEAAKKDELASEKKAEELQQVVVTGTLIHGVEPASRVSTYTRADIESQGFGSLEDWIQSVPQNFNGGASENTAFSGSGNSSNIVNATGINLRGLGNDATLVLLNGQRIAPANWQGNFVDLSMIPLSAIERVEVMPDGASAIYGSDAVGGVVNFILRQDLEGAETRIRYGSVSQGGRDDVQVSQAFGHGWESGSALLVYDFDQATALNGSDRPYTAQTTTEPFTLLPRQERNSVLLTAQQNVGPALELFGDGTYSHRTVGSDVTGNFTFPASQDQQSNIDSYSVTAGARANLSDAIKFELTANYDANHTRYDIYDLTSDGALFTGEKIDTHISALDGKVDGTLMTLPTGALLFAAGGQFRRETFSNIYQFPPMTPGFEDSRTVGAGFAELNVPLIGSSGPRSQASILELELADRYERYSDFGRTNNPKFGLIWRALPELKFRATYGTSFVAPLLSALNPTYGLVAAVPGSLAGAGVPDFIYVSGGNPNLQPQKSKDWTLGVDFSPVEDSRARAYANYYHISYTNRINNALSIVNSLGAAFQLGPPIVQLNPPASTLQALESAPNLENFGVPNLATVSAILDDREQNLSSVETSGVDFGASYKFGVDKWRSEIGVEGTYIFKLDNQVVPTSPVVSFLNQAGNPIDLKLRAHGSLQNGPISAALFLNYINSYANIINSHSVPISSWTTVDLTTSYAFSRSGPLYGTTVQLGVTNLMDKAPPYVANPNSNGVNYDGANANALGRFVYLQLLKRW